MLILKVELVQVRDCMKHSQKSKTQVGTVLKNIFFHWVGLVGLLKWDDLSPEKTKQTTASCLWLSYRNLKKKKKIKAKPATFHFVIWTSVQLYSGSTRAWGCTQGCSKAAGSDLFPLISGSRQTPWWLQTAAWFSWSRPARLGGRGGLPVRAGSALEGQHPGRKEEEGCGPQGVRPLSIFGPV